MTLKTALQLKTVLAIWQKAVKSFPQLRALLVRAVPLIVGGQSRGFVKAVSHFARMVIRIRRHQGDRGLALFLKASQLLIQRLVSGNSLSNPRLAGVAISSTRKGVPRWIPKIHRLRILKGDHSMVSFYLGLCTLYRVLDFKGKLSLSTITNPTKATTLIESQVGGFLPTFMAWILPFGVKAYKGDRDREDSVYWGQPNGLRGAIRLTALAMKRVWSFTSGPNSTYSKVFSIGNSWIDMVAIVSRPWLHNLMDHYLAFTGHPPLEELIPWFHRVIRCGEKWSELCYRTQSEHGKIPDWDPNISWAGGREQFDVGALSIVEEPGKKRIVAMVDIWTQWLLYPLHRFIFDRILKKIPQDGTFDQQRPVKALLGRAAAEGKKDFWSFDLSAATDRLPIGVQVLVLAAFTHLGFACTWRELLTEREYRTPKEYATTHGRSYSYVKYAVGQPMGAYSSWAMLALTHHVLVQYAAYRAGHRSWFAWYAVLGDDVVIADRAVANQYVRVMGELGVEIGFHKSIISNNSSLEFAKRFYVQGKEVSPLSLSGIAVGWLGPGFVPETKSASELRHGKTISLYQIARYMGVGFKAASGASNKKFLSLPRVLRSALLLISFPAASKGAGALLSWYLRENISGKPGRLSSAAREEIFTTVWGEVVDSVLDPAYKRLRSVTRALFYPNWDNKNKPRDERIMPLTQCLGDPGPEYDEWFKMVIGATFTRSFLSAFDRAGELLQSAKKVWAREESLNKALPLLNLAMRELNVIPRDLRLRRRVKEDTKVSSKVLDSVLLPRTVKRWARVRKIVDRKGRK